MKDKIIKLEPKKKTSQDKNLTSTSPDSEPDTDHQSKKNYPTCVRLISPTSNEERLFLPSGVHDVDKIPDYPEVVFNIVGGDLDSYNFTIEVCDE